MGHEGRWLGRRGDTGNCLLEEIVISYDYRRKYLRKRTGGAGNEELGKAYHHSICSHRKS